MTLSTTKWRIQMYRTVNANSFDWMSEQPENSVSAIVTDPPYGVKEYTEAELQKKRDGKGGIWRLPPTIGGSVRQPLPRFSVINESPKEIENLKKFFFDFGTLSNRILMPGGHLILAGTPLLVDVVSLALRDAGLERRGEVIRVVKTFRGGDRPKNHEIEFPEVSVMPRGNWEPWLIFRKPISEKTVSSNLDLWQTGALRRPSADIPFNDLIISEKTPKIERVINNHPSIKPQSFMREIVRAALPLGQGVILDPFMGSGSTLAAAEFLGYDSIGIEADPEFFKTANESIPELASLYAQGRKVQNK